MSLFCIKMERGKANIVRLLLLITAISIGGTSFTKPNVSAKIKTIVIDAGHGGHDPGCQYGGAHEKDVTLAIALKLGKILKEKESDIKVIYTRETDTFIELYERAAIANRNKAVLFISIHCNANPKITVSGTETYAMGLYKAESNLSVSKRENDAVLLEDNYDKHYDGFDPNSPEANIIFSLYQSSYLNQSLSFAQKVQTNLHLTTLRADRGIKQAGFLVLWKTTMPSVLIETGFLSNADDRKVLTSSEGQENYAKGIYKAVKDFKSDLETVSN